VQYAQPTLPTTTSMVAYPQYQTMQTGPFQFYPSDQAPAAPAAAKPAAKPAPTAAKKKKSGSCACCCGPKKAPAKKGKK